MCNFSDVRLLLIDDNAIWQAFAIKHLNEAGLRVIEVAADGKQGVAKARTWQPNVLLMDVSMPHINGIEAAAPMRNAAPQSKIIFVSATDDPHVIQAAMEVGGLAHVMKPRAGRDLIPAIRRVLQSV